MYMKRRATHTVIHIYCRSSCRVENKIKNTEQTSTPCCSIPLTSLYTHTNTFLLSHSTAYWSCWYTYMDISLYMYSTLLIILIEIGFMADYIHSRAMNLLQIIPFYNELADSL